jgi:hypothetical protein
MWNVRRDPEIAGRAAWLGWLAAPFEWASIVGRAVVFRCYYPDNSYGAALAA